MTIKKISKEQPDTFEFITENMLEVKKIIRFKVGEGVQVK